MQTFILLSFIFLSFHLETHFLVLEEQILTEPTSYILKAFLWIKKANWHSIFPYLYSFFLLTTWRKVIIYWYEDIAMKYGRPIKRGAKLFFPAKGLERQLIAGHNQLCILRCYPCLKKSFLLCDDIRVVAFDMTVYMVEIALYISD